MALQSEIKCAEFDSDLSTAILTSAVIFIYDDSLDEEGYFSYEKTVYLDFTQDRFSLGYIKSNVFALLPSIISLYQGVQKNTLVLPTLLRAEEKLDASGTVTNRKEFY